MLEELIRAAPTCCASIFRTASRTTIASACDARAQAAAAVGKHVALLGDLQGPKIRIERFAAGRAMLTEGAPSRSTRISRRTTAPTTVSA